MEMTLIIWKSDFKDKVASHFRFEIFRRMNKIRVVRECKNFFEILGDDCYLDRIYDNTLSIVR